MTRAKRRANRFRWIILIVGVLYSLAAIGWLILPIYSEQLFDDFDAMGFTGTPLDSIVLLRDVLVSSSNTIVLLGANVLIFVGLILITQWLFLRPARTWAPKLTIVGKPMKRSILVAAFMAMLLTVGAMALVIEIPNWWESKIMDTEWSFYLIVWGSMLILWIIWTIIFWIYWRQGDRYTQLGKMIRALMAGSLIEAVIAIPVHVWVMRQRDCYCTRGTHTTLVLSGTVLFWAFGPGIVLLFMKEKYRQAKLFPMCTKCGYDLRGSGEICPECGTKREICQSNPAD